MFYIFSIFIFIFIFSAFKEYIACSEHTVRRTCGREAAFFTRTFLDKISNSLMRVIILKCVYTFDVWMENWVECILLISNCDIIMLVYLSCYVILCITWLHNKGFIFILFCISARRSVGIGKCNCGLVL